MKIKKWLPYIIGIGSAVGVGIISGLLSMGGMELYSKTVLKPSLTPPDWLFPAVWTILYVLMGIGATRIWLTADSPARKMGLNLYIAQLIVNFFWSLIFFNAQAFGFAVLWLIILWTFVLLMILSFYKADKIAAFLQIPYLIWLTFALYLNIAVWLLNK